jgi:hypothetical protein
VGTFLSTDALFDGAHGGQTMSCKRLVRCRFRVARVEKWTSMSDQHANGNEADASGKPTDTAEGAREWDVPALADTEAADTELGDEIQSIRALGDDR